MVRNQVECESCSQGRYYWECYKNPGRDSRADFWGSRDGMLLENGAELDIIMLEGGLDLFPRV